MHPGTFVRERGTPEGDVSNPHAWTAFFDIPLQALAMTDPSLHFPPPAMSPRRRPTSFTRTTLSYFPLHWRGYNTKLISCLPSLSFLSSQYPPPSSVRRALAPPHRIRRSSSMARTGHPRPSRCAPKVASLFWATPWISPPRRPLNPSSPEHTSHKRPPSSATNGSRTLRPLWRPSARWRRRRIPPSSFHGPGRPSDVGCASQLHIPPATPLPPLPSERLALMAMPTEVWASLAFAIKLISGNGPSSVNCRNAVDSRPSLSAACSPVRQPSRLDNFSSPTCGTSLARTPTHRSGAAA